MLGIWPGQVLNYQCLAEQLIIQDLTPLGGCWLAIEMGGQALEVGSALINIPASDAFAGHVKQDTSIKTCNLSDSPGATMPNSLMGAALKACSRSPIVKFSTLGVLTAFWIVGSPAIAEDSYSINRVIERFDQGCVIQTSSATSSLGEYHQEAAVIGEELCACISHQMRTNGEMLNRLVVIGLESSEQWVRNIQRIIEDPVLFDYFEACVSPAFIDFCMLNLRDADLFDYQIVRYCTCLENGISSEPGGIMSFVIRTTQVSNYRLSSDENYSELMSRCTSETFR